MAMVLVSDQVLAHMDMGMVVVTMVQITRNQGEFQFIA